MNEITFNCITTTPTTCLMYNGPSIPSVKVENGDSLEQVLVKIAEAIPSIPKQDARVLVKGFNLPSKCAVELASTYVDYEITTIKTGLLFRWDMQSNLPYEVVANKVKVRNFADSKASNSAITIPYDSLPVIVDISRRVKTTCGDVELFSSFSISGTQFGRMILESKDLNITSSELELEDFSLIMSNSLKQLENKVNSIKNSELQYSMDSLTAKVSELELTPQSEVSYTDKTVEKQDSIESIVSNIYSILRGMETNITYVQSEIDLLKKIK